MKNEILKNKKAMKVVYFFLVAMLLFVSIALYFYAQNAERKNNQQGENVNGQKANEGENTTTINETDYQLNEGDYAIDVQEKDGNKILKNEKAGILLTVPNDWQPNLVYNTKNNKELKLKAYKSYSEHPEVATELSDGVMLEIYMYENNLDLESWIKENSVEGCYESNFQDIKVFIKDGKIKGQLDEELNFAPIEDSLYKTVFVKKDSRIYEIVCSSLGKKYNEDIIKCFNMISSDLKLYN